MFDFATGTRYPFLTCHMVPGGERFAEDHSMKHTTADITLDAPVERLWELLTDITLYPRWNLLFKEASGRLNVGEDIELLVALPELAPFRIRPKVMRFDPLRTFSWRYTMACGALFNWRYTVLLDPDSAGTTKFIQTSSFGGILGPLFGFGMGGAVKNGLAEMNRAIRRWGEKGNITCLKC